MRFIDNGIDRAMALLPVKRYEDHKHLIKDHKNLGFELFFKATG
jgi:hypothetical protein